MDYLALRHVHIACVATSGTLFLLRGIFMLAAPDMLRQRWVRTVPHIVDTALLASAIGLATLSGQYPFAQPWLTAKVLALCAYIVLGAIALKHGRSMRARVAAMVAALAVFGYIVTVAATRQPMPF